MYLKWPQTFALLTIVAKSFANSQVASENLYSSLNAIVNESLIFDRIVLYANFNSSSHVESLYFNDMVGRVLSGLEHLAAKVLLHREKVISKVQHSELLFFSDIKWLKYFYENVKRGGNYNLSRSVFYISSITTLDEMQISSVFRILFNLSMLNVVLVVQLAADDIAMVTYFPFTPQSCFSVQPIVVNRFDAVQKKWQHNDFFPHKLHNFYGCSLTCATWEDMPYLALKSSTAVGRAYEFDGFEGKLLEFLAENLNFTIKLYMMSEMEIAETFNETGLIFEEMFSTSADFALGGFYYKPYLNTTSPYSQTNYYYLSETFMISNVFNVYSTYEKIAYPLQVKLWYAIGLTLLLSSALIMAFECRQKLRNFLFGESNTMPQYHLYILAFGANMANNQLPRYNFSRFLLATWMLATLVIRSAYQSGMYEMLRDNKHSNPPQTIAEVLKQNYVVLLKGSHKSLFEILPDMRNVRDFNGTMMEAFGQLAEANVRTALVTQYEYFGHYSKLNASNWQRLHLVNERIYQQQLAMNVRRQSYLVEELNKWITMAQYYGFFDRWLSEMELDKKKTPHTIARTVQTNILTMNELGALFMILIWLHLLAVFVFLIEVWWHKYSPRMRRIVRIPWLFV
uniref:Ionotropic glutamate receptor C-terminal domain-containing protein n=1 Tax=Stomoxys calcitrans TaxID=35570 RepID=A0A1I8PK33_STOCA